MDLFLSYEADRQTQNHDDLQNYADDYKHFVGA